MTIKVFSDLQQFNRFFAVSYKYANTCLHAMMHLLLEQPVHHRPTFMHSFVSKPKLIILGA